jgi:hypothetical protein
MINLLVDEGYAFDYLAILEIKKNNDANQIKLWIDCFNYLSKQFDEQLWNQLITSEEYKQIVDVNKKTFDAVEKARYGEISAKEVDLCNMERFKAKQKFRNKFFPNSGQNEFKT